MTTMDTNAPTKVLDGGRVTVGLERRFRITACAATEDTRYGISGVYLTDDASRMIATNGRTIASVPVRRLAGDAAAAIPGGVTLTTDALAPAMKRARIKTEPTARVSVSSDARDHAGLGLEVVEVTVGDGAAMRHALGSATKAEPFPNAEHVVPRSVAGRRCIGLNPQLLRELADAIDGAAGVVLEIGDEGEPIGVRPLFDGAPVAEGGAWGLIMPISLEGERPQVDRASVAAGRRATIERDGGAA